MLLGEDAVNKEDLIGELQDELKGCKDQLVETTGELNSTTSELKECKEQLAEKTGELNSTTSELGLLQTTLNTLNEK